MEYGISKKEINRCVYKISLIGRFIYDYVDLMPFQKTLKKNNNLRIVKL